ncbi:MAG: acyltransferase family protein, partial [Gemmatimonadaceae bacterium]
MAPNEPGQNAKPASPRIRSIDVLRGFAILWVILFHLWGDIKFFPPVPQHYYARFTTQAGAGASPWHLFTAVTDIFFRDGFEGVPLFMMLSGLSLTMVAYRSGGIANWPKFFLRRARKLLVPYWVGVALTYAVIALIAWRETVVPGDAGFSQQFHQGITISLHTHITINAGVIFASVALVPRLLEDRWFFAPQLALWFVGLLAQYYL